MSYFRDIIASINVVFGALASFADIIYDLFFTTVGDAISNSGLISFLSEIPLLGSITSWLTDSFVNSLPFADYTILAFMIGNGVGLYVCYVVIKWCLPI